MNQVATITLTLQPELIFSVIIMASLCLIFYLIGKKIKAADPCSRPKGIVLVAETGVDMIQNYFHSIMPLKSFEKNYYPYFTMMFVFLITANLSGLIGFQAPTSNYSITLSITLITFTLIQWNAFKKKGGWIYIKELLWPPTNLLSAFAPLISLSMRLFGNIVSGTLLMGLVYSFTGYLSGFIIPFDFLGPIIAPILHCYFDVFAGFIQTLIFVTLSSIFISLEAE